MVTTNQKVHDRLVCLDSGHWAPPRGYKNPKCVPIICHKLELIPFGRIITYVSFQFELGICVYLCSHVQCGFCYHACYPLYTFCVIALYVLRVCMGVFMFDLCFSL